MNYQGWLGNFIPNAPLSIPAGDQLSTPLDLKGFSLEGIILPPVFTGVALTFFVADHVGGFQAKGQAVFAGPTSNNDTLTINGVVTTFKTVVADPLSQVLIGLDAAATLVNLLAFLEASVVAGLAACTYEVSGSALLVTAVIRGTTGNAYTFAKSAVDITLVPSGGTLVGGGFTALYDSANTVVSMTVAQNRAYAVNPAYFRCVNYLQVRSGTAEAASRTILCSLKGN